MGSAKTDVMVGGHPMIESVARALTTNVSEVVLLGPDRPGWLCWPDAVHAEGPLAGIATALSRTTADRVFLVAVDQPYLRGETVSKLIEFGSDLPVVPVDEHGVRQVTCALYPTSIADQAMDEAGAGGSIQTLLDRVSFRPITPDVFTSWGEDGRSWFSVDTPETVAVAEETYGATV